MPQTIALPRGWGLPRFALGQRTKHGKIIGIERCSDSWNYALQINNEEIAYISENQIQPLSYEELEAEVLAEIDEYLMQIVLLQEELGAEFEIKTQFAQVNLPIKRTINKNRSTSRRSESVKDKVA
ncbi:MAG: hypothetical protein AB3A66_28685 (plasmid) [Nodularia sp. CChRGM 3473]